MKKGDQVFRYYTCEPSFIYGGGKQKEHGVVIGDPVQWNGENWVPVKWEYIQTPCLSLEQSMEIIQ